MPRFLYRASAGDPNDPSKGSFVGGEIDLRAITIDEGAEILRADIDGPLSRPDTTFATWSGSLLFAIMSAFNEAKEDVEMHISMLDTRRSTGLRIYPTGLLLHKFYLYKAGEYWQKRFVGENLVTIENDGDTVLSSIPWAKAIDMGILKILPELGHLSEQPLQGPVRTQLTRMRYMLYQSPSSNPKKWPIRESEIQAAREIAQTMGGMWQMPAFTAFLALRKRETNDKRFHRASRTLPGGELNMKNSPHFIASDMEQETITQESTSTNGQTSTSLRFCRNSSNLPTCPAS